MHALRDHVDENGNGEEDEDLAFVGPNNLLNSDQGIRVLLQVANDLWLRPS